MMEITLLVNGEKRTFSEEELVAILEEDPSAEVQTVTLIEVIPETINRKLFQSEKISPIQEEVRQLILEAFAELDSNPQKYASSFFTLIPEEKFSTDSIRNLNIFAQMLGDHMADWVELALEWAQRISNDKNWRYVCFDLETAKYSKAIIWKNGSVRTFGGYDSFVSSISADNYTDDNRYSDMVLPLIVIC